MAIKFEKRPYEEEYEMVEAFFDKYQSLIDDAPQNSLLGMIRDLDDAMTEIEGHRIDIDHMSDESEKDEHIQSAKESITHVALLLAQIWADENQDIELVCIDDDETDSETQDIELFAADPSDGEQWTVAGKPEEEKKSSLCVDCAHCKVPKNMVLYPKWAGYCDTRSKWVTRVSGCTDKFENKNEEEN